MYNIWRIQQNLAGGKEHVAACCGHLTSELFLKRWAAMAPLPPKKSSVTTLLFLCIDISNSANQAEPITPFMHFFHLLRTCIMYVTLDTLMAQFTMIIH